MATWDIKPFVPWKKCDIFKCKNSNYVSDFAMCKNIWEQNQEEKLNMWLGNNVILAARQNRIKFWFQVQLQHIDKSFKKLVAKNSTSGAIRIGDIYYFWPKKSDFVWLWSMCCNWTWK